MPLLKQEQSPSPAQLPDSQMGFVRWKFHHGLSHTSQSDLNVWPWGAHSPVLMLWVVGSHRDQSLDPFYSFSTCLGRIINLWEFHSMVMLMIHNCIWRLIRTSHHLLIGIPSKSIQNLQYILNSAARSLMRVRRYEHIMPVLLSLRWLPVTVRIE